MVWFLHIVEEPDGRWACSHGKHHVGRHDELTEAVAHLRHYASNMSGSVELLLHRTDGQVENLGGAGATE